MLEKVNIKKLEERLDETSLSTDLKDRIIQKTKKYSNENKSPIGDWQIIKQKTEKYMFNHSKTRREFEYVNNLLFNLSSTTSGTFGYRAMNKILNRGYEDYSISKPTNEELSSWQRDILPDSYYRENGDYDEYYF